MSPRLVMHDRMNRSTRHVERPREISLTLATTVSIPYLLHLLDGEFGPARSAHVPCLTHHVRRIVHRRTEKPVLRILTRRVVARMADHQALRDVAHQHAVAPPMSERLSQSTHPPLEQPIAPRVPCPGPLPTIDGMSSIHTGPVELNGFFFRQPPTVYGGSHVGTPTPALIVSTTQAPGLGRLRATVDDAVHAPMIQ
jgi:hypothetical protein